VLVIGYGGSLALATAGLLRVGQRRILPLQLLLPFYWLLHSIATVRAAYELLTRPHFWAKTRHGLTQVGRDREAEAPATPDAAVNTAWRLPPFRRRRRAR
jgi:hypothetical protein